MMFLWGLHIYEYTLEVFVFYIERREASTVDPQAVHAVLLLRVGKAREACHACSLPRGKAVLADGGFRALYTLACKHWQAGEGGEGGSSCLKACTGCSRPQQQQQQQQSVRYTPCSHSCCVTRVLLSVVVVTVLSVQ